MDEDTPRHATLAAERARIVAREAEIDRRYPPIVSATRADELNLWQREASRLSDELDRSEAQINRLDKERGELWERLAGSAPFAVGARVHYVTGVGVATGRAGIVRQVRREADLWRALVIWDDGDSLEAPADAFRVAAPDVPEALRVFSSSDHALARVALAALVARRLLTFPLGGTSDEVESVLARFFATHREATLAGSGLPQRYRDAIGILSDLNAASERISDALDAFAARESSR